MKRLLVLSASFIFILLAGAEVRLPAIFGDNMVLQQQTNVKLWGWCDKGEKITITTSWSAKSAVVQGDNHGKWSVSIPTDKGSKKPQTITLSTLKKSVKLNNILVGEVWLCSGQSNMEMPMKGFPGQYILEGNDDILVSANPNIRLLTVKRTGTIDPQSDITGAWSEATPLVVRDFSATAYYYARLLNQVMDVPVGVILSAWGGSNVESWMSADMLAGFDHVVLPQAGEEIKVLNRTPTMLYNGMIAPIEGYTIRGAIWYQGESNYENSDAYQPLFETMVGRWRERWGQGDFPFYFCQIAPYDYAQYAPKEKQGGKFNSAFLREAQLKSSLSIPNSGMAVLMDCADEICIHPADKKTVGQRLAMMSLAQTYGYQGFGFESPRFAEMKIEGNKAILSFENAPLWVTDNRKGLKCFEIAGEDRVFHPARAQVSRSVVEVWSESVSRPVAVRYAFKDYVMGDLFSTEGLPVSSFRTDNWNE